MIQRNRLLLRLTLLAACLALATGALLVTASTSFAYAQQHKKINATDYLVPTSNADAWGSAIDSSGRVWLALPGCDPNPTCSQNTPPGRIAAFQPSTSSFTINRQLPAGYGQPLFLAFDKQGILWFPLPMSDSIGQYNLITKVFQKWAVPTPNAGPWAIVLDAAGNIWFTEHFTNQIGRFNPTTHTFTEFATPSANSQPYGITLDGGGNVWFTENNPLVAQIGEYTTSGSLLEYKIRNSYNSSLTPHLLLVDHNGNIWWSEGFAGMLGELIVSQAQPGTNNGVTEYAYPLNCQFCGSHTSGIAVDSSNNIWFDDSLQSIFGFFQPGTTTFKEFATPTKNSHPHDGLRLDSKNHIWFDEEFANKLASATYSG